MGGSGLAFRQSRVIRHDVLHRSRHERQVRDAHDRVVHDGLFLRCQTPRTEEAVLWAQMARPRRLDCLLVALGVLRDVVVAEAVVCVSRGHGRDDLGEA